MEQYSLASTNMAHIFISYTRQNESYIEALEDALRAQGITVWRDQESLYGGQQWPKAIGEAIAATDFFLLFWSKNAADSHFVEFEWNTAVALRKTIIPCLLDDTPLPPLLRGIHGINVLNLQEAMPRLLSSLQTHIPEPSSGQHSSEVIDELRNIVVTEPEQVVRQAKAIFSQEGWNIKGNVYQAAGNINLTIQGSPEQPKSKSKLDPSVKVVGLIATILVIVISLFTLSGKVKETFFPQAQTTLLRGTVRNTNQEPLSDVVVNVQELPGESVTTTTDGGFYFSKIPGKPGDRVRVYASKNGYRPHNEYVTLPGPVNIILEK